MSHYVRPRETYGPPKTGKLTAAQKREVYKWRKELVRTVGKCEWCGRQYSLACHEIARGCDKKKANVQRSCILVLCNAPHGIKASCHSVVGAWPREKQLALLLLRRGGDYDLSKYHEIACRNKPDQCDVDGWVQVLIQQPPRYGRGVSG